MNQRAEVVVRDALRRRVVAETDGAKKTVDEFWVPRSHERADLAVIGTWMDSFEIKTEKDSLRRLPRQASAYERLFDRCTAVVAEKHGDGTADLLPEWWGITILHVRDSVSFTVRREPRVNDNTDPEILVRLLWRDEAMAALVELGAAPDRRASRGQLWRELLRTTTRTQLRDFVRHAILGRAPSRSQILTRQVSLRRPSLLKQVDHEL